MLQLLRDPKRLFAVVRRFTKLSEFGETCHQVASRVHGGEDSESEALPDRLSVDELDDSTMAVD
jgi:hypothetical protein